MPYTYLVSVSREIADDQRSLAEAARARDEKAWSRLFDENFHSLYRYALYRTHDHHAAEELASQVFEEAIKGIKRFDYRGVTVRAWLFSIARNVTSDYIKRKLHDSEVALYEVEERLDALRNAGLRVDFLRALEALTEEQQQVVVLRFVEDLSIEDCAHVLGRSPGSVKMLQSRGLERLREVVEDAPRSDE